MSLHSNPKKLPLLIIERRAVSLFFSQLPMCWSVYYQISKPAISFPSSSSYQSYPQLYSESCNCILHIFAEPVRSQERAAQVGVGAQAVE